jgi:flagellar hook-basal body complex protein FliE
MGVTIVPDIPDAPVVAPVRKVQPSETDVGAFAHAVDGIGASLESAQGAEDAFASGSGSLVDAMYERARADISLSVATATTSRILQDVQSLLSMQV